MGVQPIPVSQALAQVIDSAGSRSGVDFGYLLQTAMRESSLNPEAKATTSSAVGLFQFLEGTWLQVVKQEGPRLGYQTQADMIEVTRDGNYAVRDPAQRDALLKLRENPQMAADMAAAFTRSNGDFLQTRFGRMPSAGELYIAHFLGAAGAERMFTAGLQNPEQIAARLFPRQAEANPSIFYESGQALTIRDVYRKLVAKHEGGETAPAFAAQQMAGETIPAEAPVEVVPSRYSGQNVSFTGLFQNAPAPAGGLPTLAPPEDAENGPFFTQLYSR